MKRVLRALVNHNPDQRPELFKENTSRCASVQNLSCKCVTVGSYQLSIEETIAEGGFALVFLAKAPNGQKFALKRMFVNNEQDLEVCRREIEIMKYLKHSRNVVQLVESSIKPSGDGIYEVMILMEYCNDSLLNLMNERLQNGFSEKEVLDIFCDLCSALLDIHLNEPSIIHRDLKVENVLIDNQGRYLICDFGSATFDDYSEHENSPDLTDTDDEPPPPPSRSSSLSSIDLVAQLASKINNNQAQETEHDKSDIKSTREPVDSSEIKGQVTSVVQSPLAGSTKKQKKNKREQRNIAHLEEEIKKYTTLSYRAPELVDLYNNIPITVKSDIWALGCLLYKICFFNLPFGESVLAIQNGTFTIPQDSEYTPSLHRLISYMLDTNVETRPNIKQVTLLAFKLAGKQNFTPKEALGEVCPDINTLTMPLTDSEFRNEIRQNSSTSSSHRSNSSSINPSDVSQNSACQETNKRDCTATGYTAPITITTTSVAPLQRPRKNQRHLIIPTPPPPSLQISSINSHQSSNSSVPNDQKGASRSVPPRPHSSTMDNDDINFGLEFDEIRRTVTGRSNEDLMMLAGGERHAPSIVSHSQSDTRLASNLNPFAASSSDYSINTDFGRENKFETFDENKNSSNRKDLASKDYCGGRLLSIEDLAGSDKLDSNLTPNEELRLREICDNILNSSEPHTSRGGVSLHADDDDFVANDGGESSDSSLDSDKDDTDLYHGLAHVRLETGGSPPDNHINLLSECNTTTKPTVTPPNLRSVWSVEIKDKELVSNKKCDELNLPYLRLKPPPSANSTRTKQNVWPSSIPRRKVIIKDDIHATSVIKKNDTDEVQAVENSTRDRNLTPDCDQHDFKEKGIDRNRIDLLIGHTDGQRPLLDDDSGDDFTTGYSQSGPTNSQVDQTGVQDRHN